MYHKVRLHNYSDNKDTISKIILLFIIFVRTDVIYFKNKTDEEHMAYTLIKAVSTKIFKYNAILLQHIRN